MQLPDGTVHITIDAPTAELAADTARQLRELWWASEPAGPHPIPGQDGVRVRLYAAPLLSDQQRARLEAEAPPW